MSLGGGGGGGGSGQLAQQEEARKSQQRQMINAIFGLGDSGPVTQSTQQQVLTNPVDFVDDEGRRYSRGEGGELVRLRSYEPQYETVTGTTEVAPGVSGSPAREQFAREKADIGSALQSQQSSDLEKRYQRARNALKFSAINSGQIGGSTQADRLAEIEEENRLGGARIGDAKTRALSDFDARLEDARLNAYRLIDSGSGEAAASAAQRGIENAINTSKSANTERLFDDLFTNVAIGKVNADTGTRQDTLLSLFNQKRRPSAGPVSTSSGKVLSGGGYS